MSRPESNNAQTLITQHLDLWSSAITAKNTTGRGSSKKIELYGVKKLRELILELAVRGKLVPQDPNDEPVASLDKVEDVPFDLETGWKWCRLGSLVEVLDKLRKPISKKDRKEGPYPYYGASGVVDHVDNFIFNESLVLVGEDGAKWGSGESTAFPIDGKTWVNNHAHVLRPNRSIILDDYLVYSLTQQDLQEYITGITVPKLNQARLVSIKVAVPPVNEQHRIVAKVDELMALCDQLENQTEQSLDSHATLADTLLDALTQAQSHTELMENWQRLEENWDILFPSTIAGIRAIDKLKQTILQLAVMGKLAPQDANDEPASELLSCIAAEKEQLIKDKKIKKQKPLPPIADEEKPFALPEGWEWERLQDITSKITDGDHKTPKRIGAGMRMLSAKNVRDGYLDFEEVDYISQADYEKSRERCLPEKGDLLVVSVGGTIGRSSLVPSDSEFSLVRSVALIKPLKILSEYLKLTADSPLLQSSIHSNKRGGAQPCLYLSEIAKFPFPLPPFEEQKRIVAKVEELTSLCDQLKQRLQTAQHTQQHFTDAVVAGAVA